MRARSSLRATVCQRAAASTSREGCSERGSSVKHHSALADGAHFGLLHALAVGVAPLFPVAAVLLGGAENEPGLGIGRVELDGASGSVDRVLALPALEGGARSFFLFLRR